MDVQRLVAMANDIAAFFDAESGSAGAAESVRLHLRKVWAPRMRHELIEHVRAGGSGLTPTACAAVEKLAAEPAAP